MFVSALKQSLVYYKTASVLKEWVSQPQDRLDMAKKGNFFTTGSTLYSKATSLKQMFTLVQTNRFRYYSLALCTKARILYYSIEAVIKKLLSLLPH